MPGSLERSEARKIRVLARVEIRRENRGDRIDNIYAGRPVFTITINLSRSTGSTHPINISLFSLGDTKIGLLGERSRSHPRVQFNNPAAIYIELAVRERARTRARNRLERR